MILATTAKEGSIIDTGEIGAGPAGGGQRPLRVDWHSLLAELPRDFNDDKTEYENFPETKAYVVERLEHVIHLLSEIVEQVRSASDFEGLDLGWWSPLIEPVESEH